MAPQASGLSVHIFETFDCTLLLCGDIIIADSHLETTGDQVGRPQGSFEEDSNLRSGSEDCSR